MKAAYWGLPSLFCLALYWPGLLAWFHDDDFAFLNLLPNIHSGQDLFRAVFQPTVHGTWRPLSERVYFLALQFWFGSSNAFPFRVLAFLTQFANLALISAITFRLTRSRLAGFLAPILWIANSKLIIAMVWTSAYMYALCGFCLLSAFWLLLRHIETDERRYYAGMWAVFLIGFGVMETNIVFPALAAAYTWLRARPYFRKTLPLFGASILFVAAHQLFVHKQTAGLYKMHLNSGILKTLWTYWAWAFEPVNLSSFTRFPDRAGTVGMIVFTLALIGFAGYQAYRRNLLPLFFLCWFGIVIAPVLPLRDHISDYYLTLPIIGIAMLGAYAFAQAFQNRILWRSVAVVLVVFFLAESVPVAYGGAAWYCARSRTVKDLVLGVAAAHQRNPDKTIVLTGIDDALFSAAISQHAFRFLGAGDVFLAPGSESRITNSELGSVADFVLPAAKTRADLANGSLEVLEYHPDRLIDITGGYIPPPAPLNVTESQRVDVGDPASAGQLGSTWYGIEEGFRWMPKQASVRMTAPAGKGKMLYLSGYCPAAQIAAGPLPVTVSIDGARLPPAKIDKGDAPFGLQFPLKLSPGKQIEIVVEVARTFQAPADPRELGLAFGVFEIR